MLGLPPLAGAAEFSSKTLGHVGKEAWEHTPVFVRSWKAVLPVNTAV